MIQVVGEAIGGANFAYFENSRGEGLGRRDSRSMMSLHIVELANGEDICGSQEMSGGSVSWVSNSSGVYWCFG